MGRLHAQSIRARLRERLFGVPPAPLAIGRFEILSQVGAGAMGEVYAAYDPQLERKVALKLVHAFGGEQVDVERLLGEARAAARLSHPNVVAVHDVGRLDDDLFITFELVDGEDLRRWMARPRRWQEVVEIFVQVGRGLHAAHEAGVIHRDVKPENILVGVDCRVRVTDFGLARGGGGIDEGGDDLPDAVDQRIVTATSCGVLVGTPRYMAPELLAGGAADRKSDQFALCVALFEALYRVPPFAGTTLSELSEEVAGGRVREVPDKVRVPAWLRAAVLRGLRPEPADRHPTVEALVSELARRGTRRRVWLAPVAALVIGGATWAAWPAKGDDPCSRAAERVARVWDRDRQTALVASLSASTSYGAPIAERVSSLIDAYADEWARRQTDACRDTRERGLYSDDILDARTACFDRSLEHLRALLAVLGENHAGTVDQAVQAVTELPPLAACDDVAGLTAEAPPPPPAARAKVAALQGDLARSQTLASSGRHAEARDLARAVVAGAAAIPYAPLEAEALVVAGLADDELGAYDVAEAELSEAYFKASSSRSDRLAARAAGYVARVVGVRREQFEDAETWARHARAALERIDGDASLEQGITLHSLARFEMRRARYDEARGSLEAALEALRRHEGEDSLRVAAVLDTLSVLAVEERTLDRAEAWQREALEILERTLPPGHPHIAHALVHLGTLASRAGDQEAGAELYRRGIAIYEATIGIETPAAASAINNLGITAYHAGRFEEALGHYQRALDIRRRALGDSHSDVASSYVNVGLALRGLGRNEEAVDALSEAVRIRRQVDGPDHPRYASALDNLGIPLLALGRLEEAEASHRQALAIYQAHFGPESPHAADGLNSLGAVAISSKSYADALGYFEKALKIWRGHHGEMHPSIAGAMQNVATALTGLGQHRAAVRHLERALGLLDQLKGLDPRWAAEVSFELAQALLASGKRSAARTQAQDARRRTAEAGADVEPIDDWLRVHGG